MRFRVLTWDTDVTWQYDAACLGVVSLTGNDPFFHPDTPRPVGKNQVSRVKRAKAFCNVCKVRQKCLQFALDNDVTGVWGGTTERERKRMKVKKIM